MTQREAALEAFNKTDLSKVSDGLVWHTWKIAWDQAIEWYKSQPKEIEPLVFAHWENQSIAVGSDKRIFIYKYSNGMYYYFAGGTSRYEKVNTEQECIDKLNKLYQSLLNK